MSFCHEHCRDAVSPLTQRRVFVNDSSDCFWIPLTLDRAALQRALDAADALALAVPPRLEHAWGRWCALRAVRDRAHLVDVVDALVGAVVSHPSRQRQQFVAGLLGCLWAEGHLAFPAKPPAGLALPEAVGYGRAPWLAGVAQVSTHFPDAKRVWRELRTMAQCTAGLQSASDLTPVTTSTALLGAGRLSRGALRCLAALHRRTPGAGAALAGPLHWPVRSSRRRSDPRFAWAKEAKAELAPWCDALASWVKKSESKSRRISFGNTILRYLLKSASPEAPAQFLRPGSDAAEALQSALSAGSSASTNTHLAHEFFATVWKALPPKRRFHHCNPFIPLRADPPACETHRPAMPTRFIRELIGILRSDWPRQFPEDWLVIPAADGSLSRVWCPVRACALLLKLMLPLRTHQVRFLESDEGDTLRWQGGRWARNTLPTAPPCHTRVRYSFLREWVDPDTGQTDLGFFVNTNKKVVKHRYGRDGGYTIPWSHTEAIGVVEQLLQWQQAYNALAAPARWEALNDLPSVKEGHPRSGPVCFLMRDPNGTHPNEPVSPARLKRLWVALLREYEQRLAARGERLPSGQPIRLFHPTKSGAMVPRFDLHSLRVSLLTALYLEGGVPLPFLSKCIAGHASIAMTLHYLKLSPQHMNDCMNNAAQRIRASEHANLQRYLVNLQRDIRTVYASNEPVLARAAVQGGDDGLMVGGLGLCPANRQRCQFGGKTADGRPAPTPGGYGNCLRCSAFATGPAFLDRLVDRFNTLSDQLRSVAVAFRAASTTFDALEQVRLQCAVAGQAFAQRADYEAARAQRETAMREVDRLSLDWQACYGLIERSKAAIRPNDLHAVPLVLVGNAEVLQSALGEAGCDERLRSICKNAFIHEGIQVKQLPCAQVLDAVLAETSAPLRLSEPESRHAGREHTKLLMACQRATPEPAGGDALVDRAGLAAVWRPVRSASTPIDGATLLARGAAA